MKSQHMAGPTVGTASRRSLDVLFSESVRKYPDHCALFIRAQSWSYSQLDAECTAIAQRLDTAEVGRGRTVGLIYARSIFSYASVVAIMRAQRVYVPLNPKAPAERLLKIIEDAEIECVIVDPADDLSEEVTKALCRPGLQIIYPNNDPTKIETIPFSATELLDQCQHLPNTTASKNSPLAYIIYTSGSTGEPKGVSITHESACRCIEKLHDLFGTNEKDRFTQFSALSFDYSLAELFWCWRSGAGLYVPAASEALVPLNFAIRHEISVWFSVPSLASFISKLGLLKNGVLPNVRLSLFGGEALPFELVHAWSEAARDSRIFNLYGPTEVTIVSTYFECTKNGPRSGMVPIGTLLPGLRGVIVDDGHVVEQDGVPGELWLAGDQLAAGYWRNPTATHAAFVLDKIGDVRPTQWYRTGDLVSNQRGVGIVFRGRVDRQVKLRGLRIELQEIEAVLREAIRCALVAVVPVRNAGGMCERIIAYCDELTTDEATIKARCLRHIPAYMVPERILELSDFPFSSHGKVDYLVLAARASQRSD